MRIILDDEQDGVSRRDIRTIVKNRCDSRVGEPLWGDTESVHFGCRAPGSDRRADKGRRQIQRKCRALAGIAAQLNLAAEQVRKVAADRHAAGARLHASPAPLPPYLRLVPASACWKASKIIFCFSAGMPMPVSETSNATTDGAWLSVA